MIISTNALELEKKVHKLSLRTAAKQKIGRTNIWKNRAQHSDCSPPPISVKGDNLTAAPCMCFNYSGRVYKIICVICFTWNQTYIDTNIRIWVILNQNTTFMFCELCCPIQFVYWLLRTLLLLFTSKVLTKGHCFSYNTVK